MNSISLDDVKKLARLSALSINDNEAESLRVQLAEILAYVQQLDNVDTDGLEPTYQVTGLSNVMRNDKINTYNVTHDSLLANAPATHDGQIEVPRVLA